MRWHISSLLGIEKGFVFILYFSFLKYEIRQIVSFFLVIINVGPAHSESSLFFYTLSFIYLLSSVFRVSSSIIGKGIVLS